MGINVIVAAIPSNTEMTPFRWVGLKIRVAIMKATSAMFDFVALFKLPTLAMYIGVNGCKWVGLMMKMFRKCAFCLPTWIARQLKWQS